MSRFLIFNKRFPCSKGAAREVIPLEKFEKHQIFLKKNAKVSHQRRGLHQGHLEKQGRSTAIGLSRDVTQGIVRRLCKQQERLSGNRRIFFLWDLKWLIRTLSCTNHNSKKAK